MVASSKYRVSVRGLVRACMCVCGSVFNTFCQAVVSDRYTQLQAVYKVVLYFKQTPLRCMY